VEQSPKLLQLSGIGDSAILGPLGIATRIDLKTVGKNFQDQVRIPSPVLIPYLTPFPKPTQTISMLGAAGNGFKPGGHGPSNVIAFPNLYQLFGSGANAKVQQIRSNLNNWAASQAGFALNAAALREIYQLQANLVIDKNGEQNSG
jgi:choline dehydrogenase